MKRESPRMEEREMRKKARHTRPIQTSPRLPFPKHVVSRIDFLGQTSSVLVRRCRAAKRASFPAHGLRLD